MLAHVQSQEVHLVVNPAKGTIRGWTDIYAVPPAPGQTVLGLHTLGHSITQVSVNGLPAEYQLPVRGVTELAEVKDTDKAKDVAEQAYFIYSSLVVNELQPDLVIQLPDGWQPQSVTAAGTGETAGAGASRQLDGAPQLLPGPGDGALVLSQEPGGATPQQPGTPPATVPDLASPGAASNPPLLTERLHIHVAFHKVVDTSLTSALSFVPCDDRTDDCEVQGDSTAARHRCLVSDPQLRRARELFPCCDVPGTLTSFTVHVTVPHDHVAVCEGLLRRCTVSHVLGDDGQQVPHARTFVFETEYPVNVSCMLLATGPLCVVPVATPKKHKEGAAGTKGAGGKHQDKDKDKGKDTSQYQITCFGPPGSEALVSHTARPLHLIFNTYAQFLGVKIPLKHLYVVFVPAAALRARTPAFVCGSNIILMSSDHLVGPEAVESVVTSGLLLARGVASCLFGGLIQPDTTDDAWIIDGLAGYLTQVFLGAWLGKNELAWRRHKERQAVAQADNGGVPPLSAPPQPGAGPANLLARQDAKQDAPDTRLTPPAAPTVGNVYGTDKLELGLLRQWKSEAIICSLERKVGEDTFKRLLGSTVSRAPSVSSGSKGRNIRTAKFLNQMQKNSGQKNIDAFAHRWIYGRGCPAFELGVIYKTKDNKLDLALRQSGSQAYRHAALMAAKTAGAAQDNDDGGRIKAVIYEAEGQSEVDWKLTPSDTLLYQVGKELQTKVATKRPTQKRGKKEEVKEEVVEEADGGPKQPLLYVRLDPAGDWLCTSRVYQSEASWVAQLERSKDVVAQSQAVAGLAMLAGAGGSAQVANAAVTALAACLRSKAVFCRVRAEAALALGLTATAEQALPILIGYLHDALYDPATLSLKPNSFSDMSEYVVVSALPIALGLIRSEGTDRSPPEAMDMVLDYLDNCDNSGNAFSDAGLIAAFIEAVGHMQPSTPQQLARLLQALDRWLALEDLAPSPEYIIGSACLTAMHRLSFRLTSDDCGDAAKAGVRSTLQMYTGRGVPLPLRLSAAATLMAHVVGCVSENKGTALIECLLELKQSGGWGPSGRAALVASAFNVMGDVLNKHKISPSDDPGEREDAELKTQCGVQGAVSVYQWMRGTRDAYERQCLFMLLQRVAKKDPTLYMQRDEEEVDGAAEPQGTVRSGGAVTGITGATGLRTGAAGGPTASGAPSLGQTGVGGTAKAAQAAAGPRKFKVRVGSGAAASMGPTASGGTVGAITSSGAVPGSPSRSHFTSAPAPSASHLGGPAASIGVARSGTPLPAGRAVDDEVVQPVRPAAVPDPAVAAAMLGLAAPGGSTIRPGAPQSPPRDPRTRGVGAAGVLSTPPEGQGAASAGTAPAGPSTSQAAAGHGTPPARQFGRGRTPPPQTADGTPTSIKPLAPAAAASTAAVPALGAGVQQAAGRSGSPAPSAAGSSRPAAPQLLEASSSQLAGSKPKRTSVPGAKEPSPPANTQQTNPVPAQGAAQPAKKKLSPPAVAKPSPPVTRHPSPAPSPAVSEEDLQFDALPAARPAQRASGSGAQLTGGKRSRSTTPEPRGAPAGTVVAPTSRLARASTPEPAMAAGGAGGAVPKQAKQQRVSDSGPGPAAMPAAVRPVTQPMAAVATARHPAPAEPAAGSQAGASTGAAPPRKLTFKFKNAPGGAGQAAPGAPQAAVPVPAPVVHLPPAAEAAPLPAPAPAAPTPAPAAGSGVKLKVKIKTHQGAGLQSQPSTTTTTSSQPPPPVPPGDSQQGPSRKRPKQ